MKKDTTFVRAMVDFFGRKPGETLQEFAQELRTLTAEDKTWFAVKLRKYGYTLKTV